MAMINSIKGTITYWWLFLVIGILLILLGSWIMNYPVASYLGLSIYFSFALFVTGIIQIIVSISNAKSSKGWGWQLTSGILETILGIILLAYPALTMSILPLIVGFWLMLRGVSLIASAVELQSEGVKSWWILLLGGILATIISFLIIINPFAGMVTIVFWTALSAITSGIFNIILSLRLRKIKKTWRQ